MNMIIRAYQDTDLPAMNQIWNEVVEDGVAFPQEDFLNAETGKAFFAEQTYTAVRGYGHWKCSGTLHSSS